MLGALVPETPIHKDSDTRAAKYQVSGTAELWKRALMLAESQSEAMDR